MAEATMTGAFAPTGEAPAVSARTHPRRARGGRALAAASIAEIRDLARKALPRPIFDLADTGAGDGTGQARNIELLRAHRLYPRVLRDMAADPDQSVSLLGQRFSSPFGITATGMAGLFWPHADLLLAEAAAAANIPFILSNCSNDRIRDIVAVAPDNAWFQLYPARDPAVTDGMIRHARDAGAKVLVVTVDWPVAPRFEVRSIAHQPGRLGRLREGLLHPAWTWRYLRSGEPLFANWQAFAPEGASAGEILAYTAGQWPCPQSWKDIERMRALWPGKMVLKGIAHPDDARIAREAGADAITVSNHGGKAHPRFPATTEMLPAVRAAVGDAFTVMADGGVEHGADAATLKCLGADFCFFGRITLYGAAAGGLDGINRVLQLLRQDIAHLLSQLGCARFEDLDARYLLS